MAGDIVSPSFYADFGALTALGKQAKQNDPQAIREAARQFESLFTEMMLKSMRAAKLGDDLGESQESDFYQDMYDQQLAVQMSQGKGLGLAEMLVQQLTRSGASLASASPAAPAAPAGDRGTPSAASGASASTSSSAAPPATAPQHPGGASLRERIGFIQTLAPYAQRAAATLGVSADTLIAQAALETGWGRHVVGSSAGGTSHNLFGIKAGSGWQGSTATASTTEFSGGSAQRVRQAFRSYASVQQSVSDYVSLLQGRAAYAGALGSGADAGSFAGALQRGGYATDPNYVAKLEATTASVRSLRDLVAAAGPADPLKLVAAVPIKDGGEPA